MEELLANTIQLASVKYPVLQLFFRDTQLKRSAKTGYVKTKRKKATVVGLKISHGFHKGMVSPLATS